MLRNDLRRGCFNVDQGEGGCNPGTGSAKKRIEDMRTSGAPSHHFLLFWPVRVSASLLSSRLWSLLSMSDSV